MNNNTRLLGFFYFAGDFLLIQLVWIAVYAFWGRQVFPGFSSPELLYSLAAVNLVWVACAFFFRLYTIYRVVDVTVLLTKLINSLLLFVSVTSGIILILNIPFYRKEMLYFFGCYSLALVTWRILAILGFRILRKKGFNNKKAVILGYNDDGKSLYNFMSNNPDTGLQFMGFFDDAPPPSLNGHWKGTIDQSFDYILDKQVDEIYVTSSRLKTDTINKVYLFADNNMLRVKMLPEYSLLPYNKMYVTYYDDIPVMSFRNIPLDEGQNRLLKRAFDVVFSFLVIVLVVSWLFPVIALLIKISSKGPVLFRQKRSGKDNHEFWCYKFRSMYMNTEADTTQATRNDKRITPIGMFLRKTSLDEIPQFFNVLAGHMSVVGPRPHMLKHTQEYRNTVDRYMVRHFVKPGITGLAQIRGYRGETSAPYAMKNRVKLDIFYIENWSFWLDLKIILLTIVTLFSFRSE